jgi:hypothetical protein
LAKVKLRGRFEIRRQARSSSSSAFACFRSRVLCGGIAERDLDALSGYWKIMPALRAALLSHYAPATAVNRLLIALGSVTRGYAYRAT